MTFSFTAMGVLVAYMWFNAGCHAFVALDAAIRERKYGKAIGYLIWSGILAFLLIVR